MSSTYSTNLAIELIGTGDQSGAWGTTTNNNLGTLLEQAISGYVTQAITDGADTVLTMTPGLSATARNIFIECTGALTAARNLVVPANKKLYFIYNNTSGGYAVTVKVSGQTGVSVANGSKVILVCNGTDVVNATSYLATTSTLPVSSGGTGVATLTGVAYGNGTSAFTAATGSQLASAIGSTAVTNATNATNATTATNLASGTANQIPYQTGAGATSFLTAPSVIGSYLGWNGSALTWSTITTTTPYAVTFNNSGSGDVSGTTFNGAAAKTISYNTIGAPSTTGTNATGTWGIDISGNAATATSATTATNLAGGAASRIPYQTGSSATGFIAAPTTASTYLSWDGTAFAWAAAGGGTPAGSNTQIQYNNSGAFGASSNFVIDTTNKALTAYSVTMGAGKGASITNTVVGRGAMAAVTTGASLTAVGQGSLAANTDGTYNTAIGQGALATVISGNFNTAVGSRAGALATGSGLALFGDLAGNAITLGGNNTLIGATAGASMTTATGNTFVGANVGYYVTGSKNTIIGSYLGNTAPISTTGSNFIVLSDGDGTVQGYSDSSGNWTFTGAVTANSDERVKTNWRDLSPTFIQELANVKVGIYDRTDTGDTQVGVSAQALQPVLEQAVSADSEGKLSVAYGNAALVAAVKLAEKVVALETKLVALESKLNKE